MERFDEETLAANGITPSEGAFSVKAVSGLGLTNPENLAIDKIVGETLSAERSGETVWYTGHHYRDGYAYKYEDDLYPTIFFRHKSFTIAA